MPSKKSNITENDVKLRTVNSSDLNFLFRLLKNRNPNVNISHKQMPTFQQHKKFVLSKPYSQWYIIYYKNKKAGTIYLSKFDEIGIFIIDSLIHQGIGNIAIRMLIENNTRKRYLANINPKNPKAMKFFKKLKFKPLQCTYELEIN